MKYVPHPYQQRMIDMILEGDSVALWADMGLGKTSSVLTALSQLKPLGLRTLVIAPKRVSEETWPDELMKWSHLSNLTWKVLSGSKPKREKMLSRYPADVTIMCRNILPWLFDYYTNKTGGTWRWREKWPFDIVVIDESSAFKRASGTWFKIMARIARSGCQIIELTGTPQPNKIEDLWSQAYLLDKGQRLEDGVGKFRRKYMDVAYYINDHVPMYVAKPGAYLEVMDKMDDVAVSLKAEDWLHMPHRIFNDVEVKMPKKARKMYEAMERDAYIEVDGHEITAGSAATVVGKLLQMCNGRVFDEDKIPVEVHKAKADALKEIISDADGPVLVFYSYTHDITAIKAAHPGAQPIDVNKWNKGKIPVMYCHPASAGHGLNLQNGGNVIVWYGVPFNLELYQQANARLYRQGQRKDHVIVHHLLMKDTIEQDVARALQRKDFSQEQILSLVRYAPSLK